jgi:hypothetical protein
MVTSTLSKVGIRPEDERLALLLFVESFLLGVGFNFLETSAFPLFLVEFSPQILPTIYILNALVVVVATWGYLRLGRRVSFGRQLVLTLAFLMGLVVALWLALRLGTGRWAVFTLPILFQVVWLAARGLCPCRGPTARPCPNLRLAVPLCGPRGSPIGRNGYDGFN